jgi:hypothetical protein
MKTAITRKDFEAAVARAAATAAEHAYRKFCSSHTARALAAFEMAKIMAAVAIEAAEAAVEQAEEPGYGDEELLRQAQQLATKIRRCCSRIR